MDGLAYLSTVHSEWGSVTTKTFEVKGSRLMLNIGIKSNQGRVEVEVVNALGVRLAGFTRHEAQSINVGGVNVEVRWFKSSIELHNLETLLGTKVRLRFHIKDADLYAFQISI